MIALDTNILVRYLVQDDDSQSSSARHYIEEHCDEGGLGLVTITAFIETYWVLTKVYGFPEVFVRQGLGKLLGAKQLIVENDQALASALDTPHPDLADALIHETGKSAGASKTVTFDKKFARMNGVELLA